MTHLSYSLSYCRRQNCLELVRLLTCNSPTKYICAVYLSPKSTDYQKFFDYLTSKGEHILSISPFSEIYFGFLLISGLQVLFLVLISLTRFGTFTMMKIISFRNGSSLTHAIHPPPPLSLFLSLHLYNDNNFTTKNCSLHASKFFYGVLHVFEVANCFPSHNSHFSV